MKALLPRPRLGPEPGHVHVEVVIDAEASLAARARDCLARDCSDLLAVREESDRVCARTNGELVRRLAARILLSDRSVVLPTDDLVNVRTGAVIDQELSIAAHEEVDVLLLVRVLEILPREKEAV